MILQGVSFTCRPGSILIDDLHKLSVPRHSIVERQTKVNRKHPNLSVSKRRIHGTSTSWPTQIDGTFEGTWAFSKSKTGVRHHERFGHNRNLRQTQYQHR